LIRCPNPECGENLVSVAANWGVKTYYAGEPTTAIVEDRRIGIGEYTFAPTVPKPLSKTAPESVKRDFNEAHLIRKFSPKASATLARRALQGMIRHRWGVSDRTLAKELEAIKTRCEEDLYTAMMGLKAIGNIGAHPEADVSLILEVEDGEAEELLNLLLILDDEWYVAREKRSRSLAKVAELASAKAADKKAQKQA